MAPDRTSSERLSWLTRLNLRGDQKLIVQECRAILDDLEVAELLIAAHAARAVGAKDVFAGACERLRAAMGDNTEVTQLRMDLANTGNDPDLVRAVADSLTPENIGLHRKTLQRFAAKLISLHDWKRLDLFLSARAAHGRQAGGQGLPGFLYGAQAVLSMRRREHVQAYSEASTALNAAPNVEKPAARLLLARISLAAGYTQQASNHLKASLAGNKCTWAAGSLIYRAAACVLSQGELDLAKEFTERARALSRDGPGMDRLEGRLNFVAEKFEAAQNAYARLLERRPNEVEAILGWIDAARHIQPAQEVLEAIDRFLQRHDFPELLTRRIALLRELGRMDQADFEQADLEQRFPAEADAGGSRADLTDGREVPRANVSDETPVQDATFEGTRVTGRGRELPPAFQPQWTEEELQRSAGFGKALSVQWRVLVALLLREIRTRFGRLKLGYLWAFLEPALHTGVLYFLWSLRGNTQLEGMPLLVFLLTGFIPFFLFSQTYSRVANSIQGNKGLLEHRHVVLLDAVIARSVLEFMTKLLVLAIYVVALALAGYEIDLGTPLDLAAGLVLLWGIGTGLGLMVQSFVPIFQSLNQIMTAVMRLLYLSSGVLFPISILPPSALEYALLNPIAHLIQIVRFSFVTASPVEGANLIFPGAVCLGMLAAGLLSLSAMQRRVLQP